MTRETTNIIIAIALLVLFVIGIQMNWGDHRDGENREALKRPPVFSSFVSPVIPLGISAAEAQGLPQSIALIAPAIVITGPRGERVNEKVHLYLKPQHNGEYGLVMDPKDKKVFRPGKYSVTADIQTKKGVRHIEQNFLWGVLAINPNKSVYRPGETAKLAIAVLDERGNMVCNARVDLQVKRQTSNVKHLSTEDGSIRVNDECRQKRVTRRPDYETEYITQDPGVYQMTLTATTKNGVYTIEDFFEVKEDVPFDIERISATRIYPVHEYPVTIKVAPKQDFRGIIEERVPEGFVVKETPHKADTTYQTVAWTVDWKAGQTYELSYTYKAPEASPQFYLLGALEFTADQGDQGNMGEGIVFREARQWQIAVDAIAYVQGNQKTNSGTAISQNFNSPNTAGNLIVATAIWGSGAVTATISDSAGNSYATAVGPTTNSARMQTWYAMNIAAYTSNNITVQFSGSVQSALLIHEYSGVATSGALDQTSSGTGTSAACDSGSQTTAYPDELIFGVCAVLTQADITAGSTFTQRRYVNQAAMSEDKVVSAVGSYSADFSLGLSVAWIAQMATFKQRANQSPSITSVIDTPDPTNPYRSVTFITDWSDADSGETVKVKVCKTNVLTNQNCDGGFWASSTVFTANDPESLVYDIVSGDWGQTRSYYVFVCDDEAACSSSTSGTFSVNAQSAVPDVKIRGATVRGGRVR